MSSIEREPPTWDWTAVGWGAPDQERSDRCSYCERKIRDCDVPLMLWNDLGWLAQFCKACEVRLFRSGAVRLPR